MRADAVDIVRAVNELYVPGKGYWNVRHPDGTTRECRHCYDLLTVLNAIPDDLTEAQRGEMTDFFARRLRTGQVEINGGVFNPLAPFGGFKQSGHGRELGRHGLEEFLAVKALQL